MATRLVHWQGLEGWQGWATGWRAEGAVIVLGHDRFTARGTQLGTDPRSYRMDYELTTGRNWITERLLVRLDDGTEKRRLDLRRADDGTWTANGEPLPEVAHALDCDLGYSPLTNSMPVLRERLLTDGSQPADFVMAWVDVPSLAVVRSEQRYEPIDRQRVRYVDSDHRDGFVAELRFDEHGLIAEYQYLARQVGGQ